MASAEAGRGPQPRSPLRRARSSGGLLTNDQFAEACSAWVMRKNTPLADLLVERGWLAPADRADVQRLVDRKLKKHGGDARASLAEAAGVSDPDVQATLRSLIPTPVAERRPLRRGGAHRGPAPAPGHYPRSRPVGGFGGAAALLHHEVCPRPDAGRRLRGLPPAPPDPQGGAAGAARSFRGRRRSC